MKLRRRCACRLDVYTCGLTSRIASAIEGPNVRGKMKAMLLHEDRLFPADPSARKIARSLYAQVRNLPIVSPHGHTQASWFAKNEPFPDPGDAFCAARPLRIPDALQPGRFDGRSGDRAAGGEGSAQGMAHFCRALLSFPRHADAHVAGLFVSGEFRAARSGYRRRLRTCTSTRSRRNCARRSSCRALSMSASTSRCFRRRNRRLIR